MSQLRKIQRLTDCNFGAELCEEDVYSLDLTFCISKVGISRLVESIGYILLMASRKAGHLPYFSFDEAKHRRFHDIP